MQASSTIYYYSEDCYAGMPNIAISCIKKHARSNIVFHRFRSMYLPTVCIPSLCTGPVTTLPQWDQPGTSQLQCYNNIAVNGSMNHAEEGGSHDSTLKSEQGSGKKYSM